MIKIKRNANLYKNIYDIDNIKKCFDEVCKNTKNGPTGTLKIGPFLDQKGHSILNKTKRL